MAALKVFEIDGATFIAIEDPRIVAAMKAFGYVWQEIADKPERVDVVTEHLEELFGRLVTLARPTGSTPPQASNGMRPSVSTSRVGSKAAPGNAAVSAQV